MGLDIRKIAEPMEFADKQVIRHSLDHQAIIAQLRAFCDAMERGEAQVSKISQLVMGTHGEWLQSALYIEYEEFEVAAQAVRPDPIIKLS